MNQSKSKVALERRHRYIMDQLSRARKSLTWWEGVYSDEFGSHEEERDKARQALEEIVDVGKRGAPAYQLLETAELALRAISTGEG